MRLRFFFQFDVLPVLFYLFGIVGLRVAEHVRMPEYQLVANAVRHVAQVERLLLGAHLRVEYHVQQQIAQLFADFVQVVVEDRVSQFVGLFDRVHPQRIERLLPVPRAFFPQFVHDVEQAADRFESFIHSLFGV